MAFAELHDWSHVDLVEGREHRGLRLGLHEAFGDFATERRHALARGATIARRDGNRCGRSGRCGGGSRGGRGGGRSDGANRSLAGEGGEHVAFGYATGFAGTFDAGRIKSSFGGETADGGRNFGGGTRFGGDGCGFRCGRGRGSRSCLGGRRGRCRSRGRVAGGASFDRGDDLIDEHFGASFDGDGDLTVDFSGALGGHLVGFVGKEGLALANSVTAFDQPGG